MAKSAVGLKVKEVKELGLRFGVKLCFYVGILSFLSNPQIKKRVTNASFGQTFLAPASR